MKVALKPGTAPVNVEGFPDSVKRSCKGALHLMANTFREVTPEELAFIREKRVAVFNRLIVDESAPAAEEQPKPEAQPPQASPPQASQPQAQLPGQPQGG